MDNERDTTWAGRAAPPPQKVSLNLSTWDKSHPWASTLSIDLSTWRDTDTAWAIPIPSPFRIEGDRIVGTPGMPGEILRPAEVPFMYSDFADIGTDPEKALAFANRFGLPGPWFDGYPPLEQELAEIYEGATEIMEILRGGTMSEEGWRGFFETKWKEPVPLLEVMRMQVVADLLDHRPVNECELPSCRKLFVWTDTPSRKREIRKGVRYCSIEHAQRAAQQRRRERMKEES
jgi:hypothetical protein